MNSDKIKQFYSELKFPGCYTSNDIEFYEIEGIHNIYLKEIDNNLSQGIKVLDVGCGTGLVSNLFASRYQNSNFTAIDFSDSIEYARNFSKTNNINNVTWVKQDFLKFNTNETFDVVICCGVLHHIPDYQYALHKLKSLIKPGGKLLLALYNPWGKVLKRFIRISYHNDILYKDQEENPYELSFNFQAVLGMCNDLTFISAKPSWNNRYVNLNALFNSENGGLALYVFKK